MRSAGGGRRAAAARVNRAPAPDEGSLQGCGRTSLALQVAVAMRPCGHGHSLSHCHTCTPPARVSLSGVCTHGRPASALSPSFSLSRARQAAARRAILRASRPVCIRVPAEPFGPGRHPTQMAVWPAGPDPDGQAGSGRAGRDPLLQMGRPSL